MNESVLEKKIKDLTWADKQSLVAAKYVSWVLADAANTDYNFINDLIKGNGMVQLTKENEDVIESEFQEIYYNHYADSVVTDQITAESFETYTVHEMLKDLDSEEIIPYL